MINFYGDKFLLKNILLFNGPWVTVVKLFWNTAFYLIKYNYEYFNRFS